MPPPRPEPVSAPEPEPAARLRLALDCFWRDHAPLPQKVLVGVSGGPDSLALLRALLDYRLRFPALALEVAHLNHLIRGEQAAADAAFVADFCRRQGLLCHLLEYDVPAYARRAGLSPEAAARSARYAFFGGLLARRGLNLVLVAHNADDQAETVLMHLLRGSGPPGLAGMHPLAPLPLPDPLPPGLPAFPSNPQEPAPARLGRPFLSVPRPVIEAYCARYNLEPRHDETNDEVHYRRNLVRHHLLPYLEANFQPEIKANLTRLAGLVQADETWLNQLVEAEFSAQARLTRRPYRQVSFQADYFRECAPGLQARLIRRSVQALKGLQNIDAAHVVAALAVMNGHGPERVQLPGSLTAFRYRGTAGLRVGPPPARLELPTAPDLQLTVPGHLAPPAGFWQLSARVEPVAEGGPSWPPRGDNFRVWLDYDKIGPVLIVRCRRPGERYRPLGAPGRRKVQDIMLEAGIARELRELWPVLARPVEGDRPEAICWIPGAALSDDFKVTPATRTMVELVFATNFD